MTILRRCDGGAAPRRRSDGGAVRQPHRPAEPAPTPDRDALRAAAGGEDPRGLRLQLPALGEARPAREPAHPSASSSGARTWCSWGPPGVGKTHLAISLAIAAGISGRRVYYATLADLITWLEEAQQGGRLTQRLRTLGFPSLMVIDEIGYLPITRTGAMLFFQLMSRRYEHASTVLTSNKGFEDWGEIFGDEVMAAALVDRLVHHCHIVNIRGNSYRMRQHRELASRLTAARPAQLQTVSAGLSGRRPEPPRAGCPECAIFVGESVQS